MHASQQRGPHGDAASFDDTAASIQSDMARYQLQQREGAEKLARLSQYMAKYGARIDVHHRNKTTPQSEQPNLGTAVPSWYYHDGRGNKIFVQDIRFDNALAHSRGGAGMSLAASHGHQDSELVVVVPRAKRNPAWHAEYLRRCEEYEAGRRRLGPGSGRVAIPDGHRLIGDGLPARAAVAFGANGRRGGESVWDAKQRQARLLADRQPQRPSTAGGGYDAPRFITQYGYGGDAAAAAQQQQQQVIAAVMMDHPSSSQQPQQHADPYGVVAVAAPEPWVPLGASTATPPYQQHQYHHQQQHISFQPPQQPADAAAAALQEEARMLLARLAGQQ